jgi:hypothetical protein
MTDDVDPITKIGTEHGCMSCGTKTEKFYFVEYYMLPRKLVRKKHRVRERFALYCPSCYEANEQLVLQVDDKPLPINKIIISDVNNMHCILCGSAIPDGTIQGVITVLLLMGGSGIESGPLAFFCSECTENHTVEF